MTKCAECGAAGTLREVTQRVTRNVAKRTLVGDVAALECTKCGAAFLDGPALGAFERRAALELVRSGVTTGEAFKFARKAAGLRASDLAELLNVTGKTVSRWETGESVIDRAAFLALLGILEDRDEDSTATLDRLKMLGSAKPGKAREILVAAMGGGEPKRARKA